MEIFFTYQLQWFEDGEKKKTKCPGLKKMCLKDILTLCNAVHITVVLLVSAVVSLSPISLKDVEIIQHISKHGEWMGNCKQKKKKAGEMISRVTGVSDFKCLTDLCMHVYACALTAFLKKLSFSLSEEDFTFTPFS